MKAMVQENAIPVMLDGKEYYMSASLSAMSELTKHYGGLDNIQTAMDEASPEMIEDVIFIIYILLKYGSLYKKIRTQEEFPVLSLEEVGILANMKDINGLIEGMTNAIGTIKNREVEVEQKAKNKDATQSK